MPGFFVSDFAKPKLENIFNEKCVQTSFDGDGFFCSRNTLDRFMDDKVFIENDSYVVIVEGVLLNKRELLDKHSVGGVAQLVTSLYERYGDVFFESFRGSFSGALFDKSKGKWIFYTNHYGDNPLFYFFDEGLGIAIGSQVNYVLEALREHNVELVLSETAIYSMLSYAFMCDDSTYVEQIHRLLPGHYLVFEAGGIEIHRYYFMKNESPQPNEENLVDELDARFRNAVSREFEKDVEYGYEHLCDLSGGLDSRMTTWVSKELGFENTLNLTYCQSGYKDEVVAEQIAEYLGNDLLFKPLDDANFMYDVERVVQMNYGLGLYSGITGGARLLDSLNIDRFGIEHTGQIGDVIVGSFLHDSNTLHKITHCGAYSNRLLDKLPLPDVGEYSDREDYMMCVRAFLGTLSTHLIRRNYTEVASPFLDIDFLNFCFSIPVEIRANHKLYKRWVLEKYPKAGSFVWEKQGVPLTASEFTVFAKKCFKKVRSSCKALLGKANKEGMNPLDYWYGNKAELRQWMDEKYNEYQTDAISEILRKDISNLWADGSTLEKTQVLTALVAIRYYLNYGYFD